MYMCPIPNVFQDRAKSLNSCKIVDKEIVCIASYIGIYSPSDKVGTVYLVHYIFENSTVDISALCNSCEDMVCCLSECIWTFFMLVITYIMRSSNSSHVSTFVLYTSLFIQPHKQKSNGVQYEGNERQYWAPNSNSCSVQ